MIIRRAGPYDVAALRRLGAAAHAANTAKLPAIEPDMVAAVAAHLLPMEAVFCALLAERDGVAVGMLMGTLSQYLPFSSAPVAQVDTIYVDPAFRSLRATRGLMRAFTGWAAENGAYRVTVSVGSGAHATRIAKLYERFGFAYQGATYYKDI